MISRDASGLQDTLTVCPFCACGCGLHLRGDGEGFLCVAPSRSHPVSEGRLCARGWAAPDAARWSQRLLTPLVRDGASLRPVSWDEALSTAVRSLKSLRDAGRPIGVLGSGRASNEDNFLAVTLARSALGTGHVDAGLRDCYAALLPPTRRASARPADVADLHRLEQVDVVLLVEGDLATTHPRVAMSILRMLRRGGRLITVGWRRTQMSQLATVPLAMSAHAPASVLRNLRYAVIDKGRRTFAASSDASAESRALDNAASLLANARRAAFVLSPFVADTTVLRCSTSEIAALADDLMAAGGDEPLMLPLPIRANTRGALDMGVAPDALPGHFALDDEAARDRLRALWGGEPCFAAGRSAREMLGQVAGLVVVADDPLSHHAWPTRAAADLGALESLVVLDSYATPTAMAAHVVLPIAAFTEDEGTLTNLEGRVQCWQQSTAAPASVRPTWVVLRDLLEGLGARFAPRTRDTVADGIRAAIRAPSIAMTTPHTGGDVSSDAPMAEAAPSADAAPRWRLQRDGAFDWGDDALVAASPLLRRDATSERRQHPDGIVTMNADDAAALGVREGWKVRVHSILGEVDVAVTLRDDAERGVLFVPFSHRDRLAAVTGAAHAVEVTVSCV